MKLVPPEKVGEYSSTMLEQTYYSTSCKNPEDHHLNNACHTNWELIQLLLLHSLAVFGIVIFHTDDIMVMFMTANIFW